MQGKYATKFDLIFDSLSILTCGFRVFRLLRIGYGSEVDLVAFQGFEELRPETPLEKIELFHHFIGHNRLPIAMPHDMSEFSQIIQNGE